jgi:hypothetical protein
MNWDGQQQGEVMNFILMIALAPLLWLRWFISIKYLVLKYKTKNKILANVQELNKMILKEKQWKHSKNFMTKML